MGALSIASTRACKELACGLLCSDSSDVTVQSQIQGRQMYIQWLTVAVVRLMIGLLPVCRRALRHSQPMVIDGRRSTIH